LFCSSLTTFSVCIDFYDVTRIYWSYHFPREAKKMSADKMVIYCVLCQFLMTRSTQYDCLSISALNGAKVPSYFLT